jgi:hypothetical protein
MGLSAQEETVIDQKGTLVSVRNTVVTTAATAPSAPLQNDIWFDTTAQVTKIFDGTTWLTINLDALAQKEDGINKSTDANLADATNTKFPTELAVKTYVDNRVSAIADDDITDVSFNGTNLTVSEGPVNFSANLSDLEESADVSANTTLITNHITADNDLSTTNEIQDASEVLIDDTADNFTAENVETALAELANASGDNIYSADGILTADRNVTQNNFDLNFDANTLVISGNDNYVGIGTANPSAKLEVFDSTNSPFSSTLILNYSSNSTGSFATGNPDVSINSGGISFRGWNNLNEGGIFSQTGSSGKSHMMFAVNGTNDVALTINESLNVGMGTTSPSTRLDVNGNARIRTLATGSDTDQIVTADTNGNLRKLPITSLETKTSIAQNTTTGVITHSSEDGTSQSVSVVSNNTNNSISSGTDGGAYFNNPIKAYGKLVPASSTITASGIASAFKNGTGRYTLTFATARTNSNYPIQLSVLETALNDIKIYVTAQTTTAFSVAIVQTMATTNYVDKPFFFTVLDY